eukprot:88820-Rhodomonas_salina.1
MFITILAYARATQCPVLTEHMVLLPACSGPLFNRTFTSDGTGGGMHRRQRAYCFLVQNSAICQRARYEMSGTDGAN